MGCADTMTIELVDTFDPDAALLALDQAQLALARELAALEEEILAVRGRRQRRIEELQATITSERGRLVAFAQGRQENFRCFNGVVRVRALPAHVEVRDTPHALAVLKSMGHSKAVEIVERLNVAVARTLPEVALTAAGITFHKRQQAEIVTSSGARFSENL